MFTALLFSFALAFVCIAMMGAGLVVVWRGARGRVVDDHDHCRACGYDLAGTSERPSRCTECGASLVGLAKVKVGRRRPRADLVIIGLAIMLLPVFAAIGLSATTEIITNGVAAAAPKPTNGPVAAAPMPAPATATVPAVSTVDLFRDPPARPGGPVVAAPPSPPRPRAAVPRIELPAALDPVDEAIAEHEIAASEIEAVTPQLYRPVVVDGSHPLQLSLGQVGPRRPPSIEVAHFSLFPSDVAPSFELPRAYGAPPGVWRSVPSMMQPFPAPSRWSAGASGPSSFASPSLRAPSVRIDNAAASTRVAPSRVQQPRPAAR